MSGDVGLLLIWSLSHYLSEFGESTELHELCELRESGWVKKGKNMVPLLQTYSDAHLRRELQTELKREKEGLKRTQSILDRSAPPPLPQIKSYIFCLRYLKIQFYQYWEQHSLRVQTWSAPIWGTAARAALIVKLSAGVLASLCMGTPLQAKGQWRDVWAAQLRRVPSSKQRFKEAILQQHREVSTATDL